MVATNVRATVFYTGRVQGVGFRWRTCRVADEHPVTGYVCNLPDGRVEMVAEGARGDVETFLDGLEGQMAGHIEGRATTWSAPTGEFPDFDVAR